VAIRTTQWRISAVTGGRPGPRRRWPSYFRAIRARCQASKVSGVTMVLRSVRPRRPSVSLLKIDHSSLEVVLSGAKYVLSVESSRFLGARADCSGEMGSHFTSEIDKEVRRNLRLRAGVGAGH
jgi:hypothetical protein